eukprot:9484185-Pyramimonas_sp.AAC.1
MLARAPLHARGFHAIVLMQLQLFHDDRGMSSAKLDDRTQLRSMTAGQNPGADLDDPAEERR